MGLLSSIGGAVKGLGSDIAGGLDLLKAGFVSPLKTGTALAATIVNPTSKNAQNVLNIVSDVNKQPVLSNIAKTIETTIAASAALIAAPVVIPAIVSLTKAAALKHPLTALTAGTIASGTGAVAIYSPKTRETIVKAPSAGLHFAENVAKFIENPSVKTGLDIPKDNPIIAGAAAAAVVGAAGLATAGAAGLVSTYLNTSAVKENTKATQEALTGGGYTSTSPQPVTIINQIPAENKGPPVVASSMQGAAEPSKAPKPKKKKKKSIKRKKIKKSKKKTKKRKKSSKKNAKKRK